MSDQLGLSDAEQDAKRKKTRREVFPDEMDQVAPWAGNPAHSRWWSKVAVRGHGQSLFRGDAAQGHIRPLVIVRTHPSRAEVLNLSEVIEVILG
jgi:hypothetical protein